MIWAEHQMFIWWVSRCKRGNRRIKKVWDFALCILWWFLAPYLNSQFICPIGSICVYSTVELTSLLLSLKWFLSRLRNPKGERKLVHWRSVLDFYWLWWVWFRNQGRKWIFTVTLILMNCLRKCFPKALRVSLGSWKEEARIYIQQSSLPCSQLNWKLH